MRLSCFSPLPPARTAIAQWLAQLLPLLQKRVEITLWTDQAEWDPNLKRYAEVKCYQSEQMPWADLNQSDLCIYHIGNSPFHIPILQVARCHPGLVVLHDLSLHDLFLSLCLRDGQWQDQELYFTYMTRYYGVAGEKAARRFIDGKLQINYMRMQYPLIHLALENALCVMVHTRNGFHYLKGKNRLPVVYTPLPYSTRPGTGQDQSVVRKPRTYGEPNHLIVFGYIDVNRQLDKLLKALSEFPEKAQFHLDIYGVLWDTAQVRVQIEALGLNRQVTLHGFVSDESLEAALASADLAINLRYPSMGETSYSQLMIWENALPSLVTRVGWYETISEDAVAFVRPEYEIADIQTHLRAFLADPNSFVTMGKNGRRILEERHSSENYAQAIVECVNNIPRFCQYVMARSMAERVGAEIGFWMSPATLKEASRNLAEEIYRFGPSYSDQFNIESESSEKKE
jgi:glycosyltransferase involved in cell wall biosynthesis